MKTSHQFAQELLARPDLPILIHHEVVDEQTRLLSPCLSTITVFSQSGSSLGAIEIEPEVFVLKEEE